MKFTYTCMPSNFWNFPLYPQAFEIPHFAPLFFFSFFLFSLVLLWSYLSLFSAFMCFSFCCLHASLLFPLPCLYFVLFLLYGFFLSSSLSSLLSVASVFFLLFSLLYSSFLFFLLLRYLLVSSWCHCFQSSGCRPMADGCDNRLSSLSHCYSVTDSVGDCLSI
mgnify:FL=1